MKHTWGCIRSLSTLSFAACAVLLSACSGDDGTAVDATELDADHIRLGINAMGSAGNPVTPQLPTQMQPGSIDIRRSLVVTEQPILARFPLKRVLDQLVSQSAVPGLTSAGLFAQWWDTQNPGPGLGAGPHCDDVVDPSFGSVVNGYPYLCRPAPSEGGQAACDPFAVDSPCAYIPIGLFNRFDLAREDGAHCGEHRIVYAKQSGITSTSDRNLVIFEASLPNPHPQQGLKGCKPVADFWASLTAIDDLERRATLLEQFYFDGQGVVTPVIAIDHFGDNALGAGQVRTNQFVHTTTGWSMREFKLFRTCAGNACSAMHFVPQTNKTNPFGRLFEPSSAYAAAADFRTFFPTQVASLAGASLSEIDMGIPDVYNTAQSQSSGFTADEMKYVDRLGSQPSQLRGAIQSELSRIGSPLSVEDILRRAQANTCAGCHRLNNGIDIGGGLLWPPAIGFAHVTERDPEVVDGLTRYQLSDALLNVFLPRRKVVFEDYLNGKPVRNPRGPAFPINGRRSHG